MKKVLVLGCTGSIGTNTLDIIRNMRDDFELCGVTAHNNKQKLDSICNEFNVAYDGWGTQFEDEEQYSSVCIVIELKADTCMYQQAGNSIVVDVLIALLNEINIEKYGSEE